MGWGAVIGAAGGLIGGLIASESSRDTARSAQYAAQLQWDIANRVQARSDETFALWRQEYRPLEQALNNEVTTLDSYRAQHATAAQRAIVEVRKQFGLARRKALECMDVHCVGPAVAMVRDMSLNEALAAGWAANLMERSEDALKYTIDHQQRQEKLANAQFGHEAYFSTDQTRLAAQIAGNLQRSAASSASDQAAAAGYLVTRGLQTIFGEGGLFSSNKANPNVSQAPRATSSPPQASAATIWGGTNQSTGGEMDPFQPLQTASADIFTIDADTA